MALPEVSQLWEDAKESINHMDKEITLGAIFQTLLTLVLSMALLYLVYRHLKKSRIERVGARFIVSAFLISCYVFSILSPYTALFGIIAAVLLAGIWAGPITTLIARPLTESFFPSEEVEDAANYSPALRMRNQGLYVQAVEAIDKELETFPMDVQGHMLKAQIWAKNRNEPIEAIAILEEYMAQDPPPPAASQVLALNQLAEISISYLKDVPRAIGYWKLIVVQFPESEAAQDAEQRIAQQSISTAAKARESVKSIQVTENNRDFGLEFGRNYVNENLKKPNEDLTTQELMDHLYEHPKNFSARRELIFRLAFEDDDPSEAMRWLQETLEIPLQSKKQRADWYHLLVDIQIRKLQNIVAARMTLKRLIDEDPDSAMATRARSRMATLQREIESLKSKSTIQLGSYDQDIGLKSRPK